jgi:integrase
MKWYFHQLRHTFACRWLERGGSKEALQRILGHSTIRLTERYGELSDDAVFGEAKRLAGPAVPVAVPLEKNTEAAL